VKWGLFCEGECWVLTCLPSLLLDFFKDTLKEAGGMREV